MVKLALSLGRDKCKFIGCNNPSGMYGVCSDHEPSVLRRYFYHAVQSGVCGEHEPPCFASRQDWIEYVVACLIFRSSGGGRRARQRRIDYCRDCTPEFKARQMREGCCSHEETVFIRPLKSTDDVVGVSFDKTTRSNQAWESAMLGAAGEIVSLPAEKVMNDTLNALSESSKPRKRGPKPK